MEELTSSIAYDVNDLFDLPGTKKLADPPLKTRLSDRLFLAAAIPGGKQANAGSNPKPYSATALRGKLKRRNAEERTMCKQEAQSVVNSAPQRLRLRIVVSLQMTGSSVSRVFLFPRICIKLEHPVQQFVKPHEVTRNAVCFRQLLLPTSQQTAREIAQMSTGNTRHSFATSGTRYGSSICEGPPMGIITPRHLETSVWMAFQAISFTKNYRRLLWLGGKGFGYIPPNSVGTCRRPLP